MKILAFTDIHGSLVALKRLEQKVRAQKPELLVCSGDVSIFEYGIVGILRRLNKLNKKIIIVHGNHEDEKTFVKCSRMFKNIIYIHKNYFIEGNALFLGYGGDGFSIVDKKFERITHQKFAKIIRYNKNKRIIDRKSVV